MSTISKPIKPYTFTGGAGQVALASEVNANFDTIYEKVGDVVGMVNTTDYQAVYDLAGNAAKSCDEFNAIYLGAKDADPTLDNDGNPLQIGALYFNTVTETLRTYSISGWLEGYSGAVTTYTTSGDGSTIDFTLPSAPQNENVTQVYISGVYQSKELYSVASNVLTFTSPPPLGTNNIEIVTFNVLPLGATDSALAIYTPEGTGVVATTVQTELRKTVRTSNFTDISDAITAAGTGQLTVDSDVAINYDLTIATCGVFVEQGGKFTVATGKTLTINGPFSCGLFQCFAGDGSVVFGSGSVAEVYPEWWGAVGDGVTDDYLAITRAITAVRASTGSLSGTLNLTPNKTYLSNTELVIERYAITVIGYNSTLKAGSNNLIRFGLYTNPSPEYRLYSRCFGVTFQGTAGYNTVEVQETADFYFKDCIIKGGEKGLYLNGALIGTFEDCTIRGATVAVFGVGTVHFNQNLISMVRCKIIANTRAFDCTGGAYYLYDCEIEGNAAGPTEVVSDFKAMTGGGSGSALTIVGGWSEGNTGLIDLRFRGSAVQRSIALYSTKFISPTTTLLDIDTCAVTMVDVAANASSATNHVVIGATTTGMLLNLSAASTKTSILSSAVLWHDAGDGLIKSDLKFNDAKAAVFKIPSSLSVNKVSSISGGWFAFDNDTVSPGWLFRHNGITKLRVTNTGGIGVGNSAAGDVTGTTKVKKIEVFDTAGASLGFIQVYSGV